MMATTDNPTPKLRWFQFRLRTLLLLMLVVSVALGWLVHERRTIAERRKALVRIGPYIFDPAGQPPQPTWRLWLLGDDWPRYAVVIECDSPQVTDAELVYFEGLTELRMLLLPGTKVTDAGVNEVRRVLPNV